MGDEGTPGPDIERVLATVEAVHAAGNDAELWPAALASIAALFDSGAATLERFDAHSAKLREYHAFGVPPAQELEYLQHYADRNPRAAAGMRHPEIKIQWDYQVLDEAAMARDLYYSEFLEQVGLRYFISGQLMRTAEEMSVVAVQRTPSQGHVGTSEIALMELLLPHVRQAFDTTLRLRAAAQDGAALQGALDWLADGAALVGPDGTLLYANEALQAIARSDDGLRIVKARLEFGAAEGRARFENALGEIERLRSGDPQAAHGSDFSVRRSADGPSYLMSVRPLTRGETRSDAGGAVAVIFVRDPVRRGTATLEMLRELFRLTAAEAQLAQALAGGVTAGTYARKRGLSPNTIYTHLRRIKEKTGCSSLPQLVRKLNGAQVAIRSG